MKIKFRIVQVEPSLYQVQQYGKYNHEEWSSTKLEDGKPVGYCLIDQAEAELKRVTFPMKVIKQVEVDK